MLPDVEFLGNAYADLESLSPAKRLLHWYKFGKIEGRFPNEKSCRTRLDELGYGDFLLADYLEANPDLINLELSRERAIVHFLSVGVFEGRSPKDSNLRTSLEYKLPVSVDNWRIEKSQIGIGDEDLYLLGRFQKSSSSIPNVAALFHSSEFSYIWNLWPDLSNEEFVLNAFIHGANRCPDASEFDACLTNLDLHQISRLRLFRDLLESAEIFELDGCSSLELLPLAHGKEGNQILLNLESVEPDVSVLDEKDQIIVNQGFTLLGRSRYVRRNEWKSGIGNRDRQFAVDCEIATRHLNILNQSQFSQLSEGQLLCSVIVSVYNGQKYLHNFLDALTSQTIFDRCEVVFIDANSSDSSVDIIKSRVGDFENVKILQVEQQISVYEAWNLGIKHSTAPLITNWNVDDPRHKRSLETQVVWLGNSLDVDVCYQDVWLSFDSQLTFDEVVNYGLVDVMPPISTRNLLRSNYVHNGPMWRRQLHDDYGYFDEDYRSAADWEFWLRCCFGGAKFSKSPWPTVGYFVNPGGVSTRPGTEGVSEANSVRNRFRSGLAYPQPPKPLFSKVLSGYLPTRRERYGMSIIEQLQDRTPVELMGNV